MAKKKAPLTLEFDYDWKDASSSFASAVVTVVAKTDERATEILRDHDESIGDEVGNRAVCFIPSTVNDEGIEDHTKFVNAEHVCWVVGACLLHLAKHPRTRKFRLEGNME